MKNSSRFDEKMLMNLSRSRSGTESLSASESTRALNSSHDSSRLMYSDAARRSGDSPRLAYADAGAIVEGAPLPVVTGLVPAIETVPVGSGVVAPLGGTAMVGGAGTDAGPELIAGLSDEAGEAGAYGSIGAVGVSNGSVMTRDRVLLFGWSAQSG